MRIWVDFENTPHVLILKPIIDELQRRNYQVIITARDCSQTIELADLFQLTVTRIGHHHGKNKMKKLLGHISRIGKLVFFMRNKDIAIAISHGSRSQIMTAGILKIPTFVMWDYEYASLSFVHHSINCLAVPEVLSADNFDHKIDSTKIINYPGIKEHIYVNDLLNHDVNLNNLPLDHDKIIISMRPPAIDAHYHNSRDGSNELFLEALKYFATIDNTLIIMLPRNKLQQKTIKKFIYNNQIAKNILFPQNVQNGLKLIWNSDLLVGGGGTMNREAAVLGVPVYSIFLGKIGAVDRYLRDIGRLKFIKTTEDFKNIKLIKHPRHEKPPVKKNQELVNYLVNKILDIGGINSK